MSLSKLFSEAGSEKIHFLREDHASARSGHE